MKCLIKSFFIFFFLSLSYADPGIHIYTHLDDDMIGKPTWIMVLRDRNSGITSPYLFDFRKGDNFWLALSPGRQYEIIISNLRFYPFVAEYKNFCGLEKKRLSNESISVEMTGKLTPKRNTLKCRWMQYQNG